MIPVLMIRWAIIPTKIPVIIAAMPINGRYIMTTLLPKNNIAINNCPKTWAIEPRTLTPIMENFLINK